MKCPEDRRDIDVTHSDKQLPARTVEYLQAAFTVVADITLSRASGQAAFTSRLVGHGPSMQGLAILAADCHPTALSLRERGAPVPVVGVPYAG